MRKTGDYPAGTEVLEYDQRLDANAYFGHCGEINQALADEIKLLKRRLVSTRRPPSDRICAIRMPTWLFLCQARKA
jgi:hypothetical protein